MIGYRLKVINKEIRDLDFSRRHRRFRVGRGAHNPLPHYDQCAGVNDDGGLADCIANTQPLLL